MAIKPATGVLQPAAADVSAKWVRQLGLLGLLRRGLVPYYQALLQEPDEPLRIAAIVALLELKAIWSSQAELVLAHAHHGAIKRRAFLFFLSVFEYGLAEQVARTPSDDADALLTERMLAELRLDFQLATKLDIKLFLAHGTPEHLWSAERCAELAGGWRESVPIYLMSLLARPIDPNAAFQLLTTLFTANQLELVEHACTAFDAAQVYKAESAIFRAAVLARRGAAKEALKLFDRAPPNSPSTSLNTFNLQMRADALAAAGSFRDAYGAYQRMNSMGRSSDIDPQSYFKGVTQRADYTVNGTGEDERSASHFIMLGFPRSGTTLLENALGAHPDIETFEETTAFNRMARWLDRFAVDGAVSPKVAAEAKDRYFEEFHRQSRKPEATRRIDKLPTLAAEGVFLQKMLPSLRYIFSIRHPYDVVLSCFRQNFGSNSATENFRTIAGSAALYDFTMSQWFSTHSLDDDQAVCYVRYEDLVQSFRPTLERALDFLGAGWNDSVLGFVEAADRRAANTPSYQKVRSGLSIGVQTSWRNYDFLWNTKETAVLKKWVKHFGYDE